MADEKRQKSDVNLADVLGAQLKVSGSDISAGSYGGILCGFGEPFKIDNTKGKFYKPGQPVTRDVFDANFGLYDKEGNVAVISMLIPVPDGGAANRRSNLYKTLKALGTGDDSLILKDGNFASGASMGKFIGRPCSLAIKINSSDWPEVESVTPAMNGVKTPTLEECKKAMAESEGIPF